VFPQILYGLPVGASKIADLAALWDKMEAHGGLVRLLVDHPAQVKFLQDFESTREKKRRWSVFVKVNGGQKYVTMDRYDGALWPDQSRAGVAPASDAMGSLILAILKSPVTSLHGFYAHAGNSYASTSESEANSYLSSEVQIVNDSAAFALSRFEDLLKTSHRSDPFILSVGSTPTAHASGAEARDLLNQTLHGKLELHAGE
jgi:D-serine ammonia-lyase